MTLLIVDDEYYLVQGVKDLLDWSALGIDEVLTAYSAAQARKVFEEHAVDILLADVEMPREDGLSLIRSLRGADYEFLSILLTGHANFDYARTAIELQAFDYLLKPVDASHLEETISKAVKEISHRKSEQARTRFMSLVRFWRALYAGRLSPDPDSIAQYLEAADISTDGLEANYFYALMTVRPRQGSGAAAPVGLTDAGQSFGENASLPPHEKALAELTSYYGKGAFLVDIDPSRFMISVPLTGENTNIESVTADYLSCLSRQYPANRHVIYTFSAAPLTAAPYAFELLDQFSHRILSNGDRVIPVLDPSGVTPSGETAIRADDIPLARWTDYLTHARTGDIMHDLRTMLYRADGVYSSKQLSSIYYALMHIVFSVLNDRKMDLVSISGSLSHSADPARVTASPEAMLTWADRFLTDISAALSRKDDEQTLLAQVKAYIDEHLADSSLDRVRIAEAVHMSPDYLSYTFHQKSGTVLSAYITGERIDAAKRLLVTTDLSAQEIAERTGFSGGAYFHKQFKKVTGMTPNAYRGKYRT